METAKVFMNGRSQAVRLPKDFRFAGDEVYVQKIGDAVILFPKEQSWQIFLNGLNSFTPEYLSEGRGEEVSANRDNL